MSEVTANGHAPFSLERHAVVQVRYNQADAWSDPHMVSEVDWKNVSHWRLPIPGKATDTQVGGAHYKGMAIQPVQFIHANGLDFLQGNVIKYTTRHKTKNGAEDVRKAIHYLQLILQMEYGE